MHGTTQSDSSKNEWETPKGDTKLARSEFTLNMLKKKYSLKLDPCASKKNTMCQNYFTKSQDGLSQEWKVNAIFNPPFAEPVLNPDGTQKTRIKDGIEEPIFKNVIGKWVKKAVEQSLKHRTIVIGILPVYTGSDWFQRYIKGIVYVDYLGGRIKHTSPDGKTGSPNFDSMLVFWDARK